MELSCEGYVSGVVCNCAIGRRLTVAENHGRWGSYLHSCGDDVAVGDEDKSASGS